MGNCPSDNQLAAFLEGAVESDAGLVGHLGACPTCRTLAGELLRSFSPQAPLPEAGARFGVYELGSELGHGGMGVVFRATDTRLRRPVALKFLAPRLVGDLDAGWRFRREALAVAALRHPNVAALFESGESGGLHYLVFELVEGRSLDKLIGERAMSEREALPVLSQLAGGVAAVHAGGIVHRDLKPSNVMVQPDGTLKVLDFGLAKLTDDGHSSVARVTLTREVLGTLAYMAPEQQEGRADDPRVDIWAIGAVAYHVLTGRPPFGFAPAEIARAHSGNPPARIPGISRDLETLVMRCLSHDAAQRPPTAQLIADDLGHIARGEPILTRPSSFGYRLSKTLRRNRALAGVAAAGVVVALGLGGYGFMVRQNAARRAQLERELGGSAQQVRALMRNAHLLPLHDIRPERAQVKAELARIEEMMRSAGSDGVGPGNAALGQGWLALGDAKRARPFLEAAFQAGERGADLSAALGFTLGALYEEEMDGTRGIEDPARRQARQAELGRTLRDPALVHLRSAGDTTPEYVAAEAAILEHRYQEGLQQAHDAFSRSQSLYEAGQLEARALERLGRAQLEAGHKDQAEALYRRAQEVFARVLDVARSDDDMIVYIAARESYMARPLGATGVDVTSLEAQAKRLIDDALTANPDNARAWTQRAMALTQEMRAASDPRPLAQKIIAASQKAMDLDGTLARAPELLAEGHFALLMWQSQNGENPTAEAQKAIAASQKALSLANLPSSHEELGQAWDWLADWQSRHGVDPRPAWSAAAREYRATLHAEYDHPNYGQLALLLATRSEWEMARGQDTGSLLAEAAQLVEEGLRRDQSEVTLPTTLSQVWWTAAVLDQRLGRSAEPSLEKAKRALPSHCSPAVRQVCEEALAQIDLAMAQEALLHGRDPTAWLAQVRKREPLIMSLGEANFTEPRSLAMVELLAARWELAQRRSPEKPLARARAFIERSLALEPTDCDSLVLGAEIHRRLGEWMLEQKKDAAGETKAAQALLARALRETDQIAAGRFERAAVERLAARLAQDPAADLARAEADEKAARAIDPHVDYALKGVP